MIFLSRNRSILTCKDCFVFHHKSSLMIEWHIPLLYIILQQRDGPTVCCKIRLTLLEDQRCLCWTPVVWDFSFLHQCCYTNLFFLFWQSPECLGFLYVIFFIVLMSNISSITSMHFVSFFSFPSIHGYPGKNTCIKLTSQFFYLINLTETVDIEILHKFHTAMLWAVWWSMSLSMSNYRVTIKKKHK